MQTVPDTELMTIAEPITPADFEQWEQEIEAALCLEWMSANGYDALATNAIIDIPALQAAIHAYCQAKQEAQQC